MLFLTPHSTKQVLQALVLSYLDYCPVVWSSAARKDLVKLQLAQNRATRLVLHCNQRADVNTIHARLSWFRVEGRLTASLVIFMRNINVLKSQIVCIVNLHTALTHTLTSPDMPPGVFTQFPNPEQIQESVQYYIEPLLHGTSIHLILLK